MTLRVYNTLTRQKELFEPVHPGKVGMYLCGPTVYKSPHIGHMVGPVIFDAIKRYLRFKGYQVTWVVNITDIDDKLIEAAQRLGATVADLAAKHTKEYFEVLDLLGINSIDHFPRATEHMPEIIAMCQALIDNGHAYAASGSVYFDVNRDADYGKLSNRKPEDEEGGSRAMDGSREKRSQSDFALWKAARPGEPAWESPWGPGRPGWHIECSAMSTKVLGPTFDIHGGGMDLMFPHHENELAQSESATGKPFAKYWCHNGLTKVRTKAAGGEWKVDDMHESSGNAVRARQLIETHGAEGVRYLLLSSHYRRPIEFSDAALADTKKALSTFYRLFERVERMTARTDAATARASAPLAELDMDRATAALGEGEHAAFGNAVVSLKMKFLEMMEDDFNTAGAIGALHEMAGELNGFIERNELDRTRAPGPVAAAAAGVQLLRLLGQVLGLFVPTSPTPAGGEQKLAKVMDLVIWVRQEMRKGKNFAVADAIRTRLNDAGITLEDGPEGTRWRAE